MRTDWLLVFLRALAKTVCCLAWFIGNWWFNVSGRAGMRQPTRDYRSG